MVGSPAFHCGRDPKATMNPAKNPAKVVVREVQRQRSLQILTALRESIGHPRQALAPLAERAVLPLHVRRAGPCLARVAHYRSLDRAPYLRGPVRLRPVAS